MSLSIVFNKAWTYAHLASSLPLFLIMLILLRSLWFLSLLQASSPKVDYNAPLHKPLHIDLILAGNFGELRPNHFHTGIDIKTPGQEGYKLYAIADGYVSRIKTGTSGYGKVVYIDHPEYGITSVYAHCQNFVGDIADYTRATQNAREFYEIDEQVPVMALPVKKEQNIALSGNTGSSSAPHLHFEIRETQSENPLNPLLFSFLNVADSRAPHIQNLIIYALSKQGYRIPDKRLEFPVKAIQGKYKLNTDTISVPAHFCSEHGGIGMAIGVYDKYNAAENVCGIYQGVLTMNGDTVHHQIMNRLDFEFNRQINTHKDYEAYKKNKSKIEKYFRTVHNQIPIYDLKRGKGILGVQPEHSYDIQFSVSDLAKNNSVLAFVLKTLPGKLRSEDTAFDRYDANYLYPDSSYFFQNDHYRIELPAGVFYEPILKKIGFDNGQLQFCSAQEPVNAVIKIALPLKNQKLPEKSVLYHHESKSYYPGRIANNWFESEVKTLGTFSLTEDTTPPLISRKFKVLTTPQVIKRLAWTARDTQSGLAYYALYIDGKYQLLEYEHKRSEFFANIDLKAGKYECQMIAVDKVGNTVEDKFTLVVR